jgi:DNA-binding winged helix-turn-helix (wHTH) protein
MALYRFGAFEFDSEAGELQNAGRRVRLRPQPAKVLEHLLKRHGALVTRAELQHAIWPDGTFVHFDAGLNSCIKQIRAALGDRQSTPSYIETLVRRGFRFIAPMSIAPTQDLDAPIRLVLAVTVRLAGDRLHVTSTLIDAGGGV